MQFRSSSGARKQTIRKSRIAEVAGRLQNRIWQMALDADYKREELQSFTMEIGECQPKTAMNNSKFIGLPFQHFQRRIHLLIFYSDVILEKL